MTVTPFFINEHCSTVECRFFQIMIYELLAILVSSRYKVSFRIVSDREFTSSI